MASSPDFSRIAIDGNFLHVTEINVPYLQFPLDPLLLKNLVPPTKADYGIFTEYLRKCNAILGHPDSYEALSRPKKCFDALKEKIAHNTYANDMLKSTIDSYLVANNPIQITKIDAFIMYNKFMHEFRDKIKRLREGHRQIMTLNYQDSPNEYPLDHVMAAKIMPKRAGTIIVANSENRHLEAHMKSLKMLHQIFNLPLPEELK